MLTVDSETLRVNECQYSSAHDDQALAQGPNYIHATLWTSELNRPCFSTQDKYHKINATKIPFKNMTPSHKYHSSSANRQLSDIFYLTLTSPRNYVISISV